MAAASYDADHVRRHSGLGVHAASRKIGKPAPSAPSTSQNRKPVIIYMVSPKVIHVEAHEFMSLVQRLTGPDGGDDQARLQQASTSSSSPRAAAARKGEGASSLVSPWLHHVSGGDHFLSPGAPGLASPSGFLDIFGPLSSSQHQ